MSDSSKALRLNISVGAMSQLLSIQLAEQGAVVDRVEVYEKNLDAVTRLYICGYIPPSTAEKCRGKILKDVFKNVKTA